MAERPVQVQESCSPLSTQAWVPSGGNQPSAEDFKPARVDADHPSGKPARGGGGFWTSTYDERHGSGWVQWRLSEEFGCDRPDPTFPLWTLEPDPAARIYEIDTYADLAALVSAYPHRKDYPNRGYGAWTDLKPHWAKIAEDFDGVHLTDEGQWATRLTTPLDLYGWDCECTLWLRWAFTTAVDLGPVRCEAKDPWWEEAAA